MNDTTTKTHAERMSAHAERKVEIDRRLERHLAEHEKRGGELRAMHRGEHAILEQEHTEATKLLEAKHGRELASALKRPLAVWAENPRPGAAAFIETYRAHVDRAREMLGAEPWAGHLVLAMIAVAAPASVDLAGSKGFMNADATDSPLETAHRVHKAACGASPHAAVVDDELRKLEVSVLRRLESGHVWARRGDRVEAMQSACTDVGVDRTVQTIDQRDLERSQRGLPVVPLPSAMTGAA